MKKAVLLASLMFASASVFGMQNNQRMVSRGVSREVSPMLNKFFRRLEQMGAFNSEQAKLCFSRDANFRFSGGNTLLMYAAAMNHLGVVCNLVTKYGVDLDIQSDVGHTALIEATLRNNTGIMAFLLDKGADPNLKDEGQELTALMHAVCDGYEEAVSLLVSNKKTNVNLQSYKGLTALMYATTRKNERMTRLLINEGSDVNLKDSRGRTALIWATYYGCEKILDILLGAGADVNVRCEADNTALVLASYFGYDGIVDRLLRCPEIDVDAKNIDGDTALTVALYKDHENVALNLIRHGADFTILDKNGETVLMKAARKNHFDVVKEFISFIGKKTFAEKNRNGKILKFLYASRDRYRMSNRDIEQLCDALSINAQDNRYKFTALIHASRGGRKEMVRLFLEQDGIDVGKRDIFGHTALWHAVAEDYEDIVGMLLRKYDSDMLRSEIDKEDWLGNTLWTAVSERGNSKIMEMFSGLISSEKQEEITIKKESNRKKIDEIAKVEKTEQVAEQPSQDAIQKDRKKRINRAFRENVARGNVQDVQLLLDERDDNGNTLIGNDSMNGALAVASGNGNLELVGLLISHGSDVNSRDANGNTPLMLAAENNQYHVIPKLICHGANINAQNKEKHSALMLAAKNGHTETVRMLVKKYKVKIQLTDRYGKTARDIVKEKIAFSKRRKRKDTRSIIDGYESIEDILTDSEEVSREIAIDTNIEKEDSCWRIRLSRKSRKQLEILERENQSVYDEVQKGFYQLSLDPFDKKWGCTEKLESGLWVRTIKGRHRLVYYMDGADVCIVSCKDHYEGDVNKKSKKDVIGGVEFKYLWEDGNIIDEKNR